MDEARVDPGKVQLLTVWNPYVFDETIEQHVEALRAAPAQRKWSWWGRIYAGRHRCDDPALIEEKWPWARAMAEQLEKREAVLYVTSFESLHAVRIDAIHFGNLPDTERAVAPLYYFREPRCVPLWFRIRDIRALAWRSHQVAEMLRELMELTYEQNAFAFTGWRLDPYAAVAHTWPVPVVAPDVEATLLGRSDWHTDDTTAHPQSILQARKWLERKHPVLMRQLSPATTTALATARLLLDDPRHKEDPLDLGAVLLAIARAMEHELCTRLVGELVQRLEQVESPRQLRDIIKTRDWPGAGVRYQSPTIGAAPHVLNAFGSWLRGRNGPDLPAVRPDFQRWLTQFARTRNDAAHGRSTQRVEDVRTCWDEVVGARGRLLEVTRSRSLIEDWSPLHRDYA